MRTRIWGPALAALLAVAIFAAPVARAKQVGSTPSAAPGITKLSPDQADVKSRLVSMGMKNADATSRVEALKPSEARFLARHPEQVKVGAIPYGAVILGLLILFTLWLWDTFH